jgi:uncharacterized protein YbjT (DUF2867 family)
MATQNGLHVLVIGATGQQGGAAARRLLERGHRVRGFTRDPESAASQELTALGAEMVKGYLRDAESITRAAEGIDVALLVTTPDQAGPEGETQQGITAVDAIGQAGVPHIVYASIADANQQTGIPHFESKRRVEEHLISIGFPSTVVAPVFFRENLLGPNWRDGLQNGDLLFPLPGNCKLQNISVKEVGAFHAHIIENHQDHVGQRIDIASAETTPMAMARSISDAAGKEVRFQRVPLMGIAMESKEWGRMFEWFDRVGHDVDIEGLKEDFPEVPWQTFSAWAKEQDWSILDKKAVAKKG